MSQGSFLAPNIGPNWVPNRIIDAEGVRKPLDRHLGGYHSALGAILVALGCVLSAIRDPKVGMRISDPPTGGRHQATERRGERINLSQELGMGGLDSKKITPDLYTP